MRLFVNHNIWQFSKDEITSDGTIASFQRVSLQIANIISAGPGVLIRGLGLEDCGYNHMNQENKQ